MCSNKLTGDFVPLVIFSIRKQNCKQKTVFGYSCISRPTQSSVVCAKINKKSMKIKNENFYQFCDNCKTPPCTYYSREAEMKIAMFSRFKEYHGNHNKFESLYESGGRCLKIRRLYGYEPYFKVHGLVSVHPKSITLGQMINLNMIFHVMVSVNLKLAPSSLLNFGTVNRAATSNC